MSQMQSQKSKIEARQSRGKAAVLISTFDAVFKLSIHTHF